MLDAVLLYVALVVFCWGFLRKIFFWFGCSVSIEGERFSFGRKVFSVVKGIFQTLLNPKKFFILAKVFFVDVIFQNSLRLKNKKRWLAHLVMSGGFFLLILTHALSKFVMAPFFSEFYSTINPFMFLRDLFGVLAIVGVVWVITQRYSTRILRFKSDSMDIYAVAIVSVILFSGLLLESVKIISHSSFKGMVEEYLTAPEEGEIRSLEAYWSKEFGLVLPHDFSADKEYLEAGKISHEINCAQCHDKPQWAFAGYFFSLAAKPFAGFLETVKIKTILWYIHYLACLIGLAYLPFSKMFHIFTVPLCYLMNAVMSRKKSDPANFAVKQMIELDACVHCGACTELCSVAIISEEIKNRLILPSEKIAAIKKFVCGAKLDKKELAEIQQGMFFCSGCYRCEGVCPAGIDLSELWFAVREKLLKNNIPEFSLLTTFSLQRGLRRGEMDLKQYVDPVKLVFDAFFNACDQEKIDKNKSFYPDNEKRLYSKFHGNLKPGSFVECYRCTTCTLECPIMKSFKDFSEVGLAPHQIMHAITLKHWDLIFSSKMLWYCVGCYKCQETCPQRVPVCDIIAELRSMAVSRVMEKAATGGEEKKS